MARKLTTSAIDHYERRTSSTYERICGDLCLICVFEMGADDLNGVCNAFAFSVGGFTSASCIFYLLLLFLSIFGQTIVVEVFVFVFFAFLGMFFIGCLFFLLPLYNGVVFCDFFFFSSKVFRGWGFFLLCFDSFACVFVGSFRPISIVP
jgi:hypothetical protein